MTPDKAEDAAKAQPAGVPPDTPFQRFERLAKGLIAVPKKKRKKPRSP
jgi:hypothetical protein